ncbi:MAG: hypothetical protein H6838_09835 [Planctomycetes bacterium]|nr:hypothetical protein [Planctomycetota bacterium]MCB9885783.1 hypothetical protein [Planctomycetota bacterium]
MQPAANSEGAERTIVEPAHRDVWFWATVLILLAGVVLRVVPELFEIPAVIHDAVGYRDSARHLVENDWDYVNTFREPLLPLLLALTHTFLGDDLVTHLRVLGLLSALAMVLGVRLWHRSTPRRVPWVPPLLALLLAVDGDQLEWVVQLSTLAPHSLLFTAAVACLVVSVSTGSRAWAAGAGVCLGLAGLSRASWVAMALPAAALSLLGPKAGRRGRAAAVLLTAAILFAPLPIYNQLRHGCFAPSSASGVHVFTRTWHLAPEGQASPQLRALARRFAADYPELDGDVLSEAVKWDVLAELQRQGVDDWEIDRRFRAVSHENVLRHPGEYLKESIAMGVRSLGMYDFTWYGGAWAAAMKRPLGEAIAQVDLLSIFVKVTFRILLPLGAVIALLGGFLLALRRRQAAVAVLLGMAGSVVLLLALAAPSTGVRRYRAEIASVLLPAIAVGAVTCLARRSGGARVEAGEPR